jgi:hypothetical protein
VKAATRLGFKVDKSIAADRLAQCLAEAGYPGAAKMGKLVTFDPPPETMFKAWKLATGSPIDFEQWCAECLIIGGRWVEYFDHHNPSYSAVGGES